MAAWTVVRCQHHADVVKDCCCRDVLDLTSPALDPAGVSVHPHEAILSTLQHGRVEGVENRTVSQFSHVSYIVKLRHPDTGHKCKVPLLAMNFCVLPQFSRQSYSWPLRFQL